MLVAEWYLRVRQTELMNEGGLWRQEEPGGENERRRRREAVMPALCMYALLHWLPRAKLPILMTKSEVLSWTLACVL